MSGKSAMFLALLGLFVASAVEARVTEIVEDDWEKLLKGEWMVEFYAPWCPACRALRPTWNEFSEWSDDLNLDGVAHVDVTENPGLSGRFIVTALPTIFHVKDGEFRQYRGPRDKDAFISFVEDKKFRELEPLPSWKNPDSFPMTVLSYFFKGSMMLKNLHTVITEEYGYSPYVSYALFALGTIVIGAALGMALVLLIDCIYPVGPGDRVVDKRQAENQGSDGSGKNDDTENEEELPDDDATKKYDESASATVRKRRPKKAD